MMGQTRAFGGGGLDNNTAQQSGFPTSGESNAARGILPAQRKQEPYQHVKNETDGAGLLGTQAPQGSQFRMQSQPMSSGLASALRAHSISGQNLNPFPSWSTPQQGFQGAQPSAAQKPMPIGQPGPQFFSGDGGNPFNPQPPQPAPQPPMQAVADPAAQVPGAPQPTPMPGASAKFAASGQGVSKPGYVPYQPTGGSQPFDFQAEMAKMGKTYESGGAWDAWNKMQTMQQFDQQGRAAEVRAGLTGRGASSPELATLGMNRAMGMLGAEAERAQLEQAAKQQQFANQMGFSGQQAALKQNILQLAQQWGVEMSDADFNAAMLDILQTYGPNATSGQIEQTLQNTLDSDPTNAAVGKTMPMSKMTGTYTAKLEPRADGTYLVFPNGATWKVNQADQTATRVK